MERKTSSTGFNHISLCIIVPKVTVSFFLFIFFLFLGFLRQYNSISVAKPNICSMAYASKIGCSLGKGGLACQQYCTDKAINRFTAHQQLFWSQSYYTLCNQFFSKFWDKQAIFADTEVLLHISLHLESHWAMPWWFDGKPTVYYFLGTDDTNWRELESFTVSLIPWWEALLNASSTGLTGKYLQWFPSRSGSLSSTFTAQVSWSRFVWQWSLAVLSFPQGWESSTAYTLWQEMFLCIAFHSEMTPLSLSLLPMSSRSPRTAPRG